MVTKKGFEVQFNWIFVLVAGAAILLFFASVIVKQKNVSETSTKSTVLNSIESIITGTSVSTNSINIIDIPNSDIDVSCGSVSIGGVSNQFQNLILFSPSLIKGGRLITQTLAFSTPYRSTNFLYITSANLRYIMIGYTDLAREINKSLPLDLIKEFYPISQQIKDSNNYKVKFVFFDNINPNVLQTFQKMSDQDVTAIEVNGDSEKGTLNFYQKNGVSWAYVGNSGYIGKSSLIGAIYSDALDSYNCNMANAFSRLNLVTKIYLQRTQELISTGNSRKVSQCDDIYKNALDKIKEISAASSNFNSKNIGYLSDAANLLSSENQNAIVYSCSLIY